MNLLLVIIVVLLSSILWSVNKDLRKFVYHSFYTGIRFHEIEIIDKETEMGRNTGVYFRSPKGLVDTEIRRVIPCEKSVYIFNLLVSTEKIDIIRDKESTKDICANRNSKNVTGYWYPETIFYETGLFNEKFFETSYKKIGFDDLLGYIQIRNYHIYESIIRNQ